MEYRERALEKSQRIELEAVSSGHDRRTTVMVRNIPTDLSRAECTEMFDNLVLGQYNCFVLPVESTATGAYKNLGWGLINFIDPQNISPFFRTLHGQTWGRRPDADPLEVMYAKDQGVRELMRNWGGLERRPQVVSPRSRV
mmetsp:Transcript_60457/g.130492  ORF Transcript_60457/g.130492 Transcript_60457/m.130492 type:complete len:141 (+) Transcript_60457:1-423(+)